MKAFTGTPGPWTTHTDKSQWAVVANNRMIAEIPRQHPQAKANIKAIATLPELLATFQGGEMDPHIQPLGWLDTLLRICSTTDAYKALVTHAQGDADAVNTMLNTLSRFSIQAKAALSAALD